MFVGSLNRRFHPASDWAMSQYQSFRLNLIRDWLTQVQGRIIALLEEELTPDQI